MGNVPFWIAVALVLAGFAIRIARRLRSDDDADEDDEELRVLRWKREVLRQMSQRSSSDDASARSDRVEEPCAQGALKEVAVEAIIHAVRAN